MDKENKERVNLGDFITKNTEKITSIAAHIVSALYMARKFGEHTESYPTDGSCEAYYESMKDSILMTCFSMIKIDGCAWWDVKEGEELPRSSVFLKFLAFEFLNYETTLGAIDFDRKSRLHIKCIHDDLNNFYHYDALTHDENINDVRIDRLKQFPNFHIMCFIACTISHEQISMFADVYQLVMSLINNKNFQDSYNIHNRFRKSNSWHIPSASNQMN